MLHNPILFYFGHHKCASDWISSIISNICTEIGLIHNICHNPKQFNYNLDRYIKANNIDFLSFTNADVKFIQDLERFLGFHVIRDPRDILVSAYYSHLYSHSTVEWHELINHRKDLKNLSKDKGLLLEIDFSKTVIYQIYNWNYSLPNIIEIKFEDLVLSPYKCFLDIFNFIGLLDVENSDRKKQLRYFLKILSNKKNARFNSHLNLSFKLDSISATRLLGIVFNNRFSKITGGRIRGEENIKSHYRKGIIGDWRNHFLDVHKSYFKKEFDDILIFLGYEKDNNW